MALTKCKGFRKDIDSTAKPCPYCGKYGTKSIGVLTVAVGVMFFGCSGPVFFATTPNALAPITYGDLRSPAEQIREKQLKWLREHPEYLAAHPELRSKFPELGEGSIKVRSLENASPSTEVQKSTNNESAIDILKIRYARGEISKEEFQRMKEDLK